MSKTFRASINNFSVSSVKVMEGLDGYIVKCDLLFSGRKIGEYFDRGDGAEASYIPAPGYKDRCEMDKVLAGAFPPVRPDEELFKNLPPVPMGLSILVDELIDLSSDYSTFKKNGNKAFVIFKEDKKGIQQWIVTLQAQKDVEALKKMVLDHLKNIYIVSAYNSIEDFTQVRGKQITEQMIRT